MKITNFDTDRRVLVIAEIGNNHEGDINRAEEMIREAGECGVDAVKFQIFQTEYFVRPCDRERFDRLKSYELTPRQFGKLAKQAREAGLLFIATPLDLPSVEWLAEYVDAFKIASGDITFYPLIERVAATGKPLILSTGASSIDEVSRAVRCVREARGSDASDLALLHCVSAYPAPNEQLNLLAIPQLRERFGVPVGYSDHSLGVEACTAAVAIGARIIEKHFTLDKNLSTFRDHQLSADPEDMRLLVARVREMEQMFGSGDKQAQDCEESMVNAIRRSVGVVKDCPSGHVLTEGDLVWLRPGTGIPPGREQDLVGRALKQNYAAGDLLDLCELGEGGIEENDKL